MVSFYNGLSLLCSGRFWISLRDEPTHRRQYFLYGKVGRRGIAEKSKIYRSRPINNLRAFVGDVGHYSISANALQALHFIGVVNCPILNGNIILMSVVYDS